MNKIIIYTSILMSSLFVINASNHTKCCSSNYIQNESSSLIEDQTSNPQLLPLQENSEKDTENNFYERFDLICDSSAEAYSEEEIKQNDSSSQKSNNFPLKTNLSKIQKPLTNDAYEIEEQTLIKDYKKEIEEHTKSISALTNQAKNDLNAITKQLPKNNKPIVSIKKDSLLSSVRNIGTKLDKIDNEIALFKKCPDILDQTLEKAKQDLQQIRTSLVGYNELKKDHEDIWECINHALRTTDELEFNKCRYFFKPFCYILLSYELRKILYSYQREHDIVLPKNLNEQLMLIRCFEAGAKFLHTFDDEDIITSNHFGDNIAISNLYIMLNKMIRGFFMDLESKQGINIYSTKIQGKLEEENYKFTAPVTHFVLNP